MKKKWFDLKIFREGFRQLSLMALAFLGILLLTSLISILQQPLSRHGISITPRVPQLMSPLSLQPLIAISFCLTAPFLTLKAFRFTTERRGSDFYHALPQRRECLFLSLLGAAFAWVFLILAASALVSGVAAGCFPAYYRFSWGDLLQYNLVILLISSYVAAVTACGIFLSGTVFSNVLVSLLLLFAPRIIIHTITGCIADQSFMLDRNFLPFPYRINLFSDFVYSFLNSGDSRLYGRSLFHWGRILYTFFALILWVGAGAFLARKRKSEAAEVPVANPRVRALVRITLAFLVWLIPLRSLLVHEHYSSFDYSIFGLFILLAFFGYELLATRNLKSLRKSLPSFGILLILCLGSLFFCRCCMRMAENWQPEAADIQHVRIMDSRDYYYMEGNSLFSSRIEETRITDKEVHRLVAELLKNTPARVNPGYAYHISAIHTKYTISKTIAIKSGLVERYRTILLEDKEMEALSAALSKDEAFVKAYMELPDEKDSGIVVESIIRPDEDNKAALQIYRSLKEEVKEIGFTEWFNMQNNPVSRDSSAWIGLQSNRQGLSSCASFTISKKLPRTWALYQQLWAEANRQNRDKLIGWIDRALAGRESGTELRIQGASDINIRAFNSSTGEDIVGYVTTFAYPDGTGVLKEGQLKKLRDILSGLSLPAGLEPEYYGPVQIDVSAYNNEEDLNCMFTGETFPEGLREILNP